MSAAAKIEHIPLAYVRCLGVQPSLFIDALAVGAQMRPLAARQLEADAAQARRRIEHAQNRRLRAAFARDTRRQRKAFAAALGHGCRVSGKDRTYPAAHKLMGRLRAAMERRLDGSPVFLPEQMLALLPGLRHHKRNLKARRSRAAGVLTALCAAGIVAVDFEAGQFELLKTPPSAASFAVIASGQPDKPFYRTECVESAIRRILTPRKKHYTIHRGVGGRTPAPPMPASRHSRPAATVRDQRGRFCRQPPPTLPPAVGGRPPVTAVAGYGADSASLSQMPNKTVSGGEKVPEQVSVGRRADESLQQYFGRVALEQEAKTKTPEGQSRLAAFDAWKRQQRTQQAAAAAAEVAKAIREREQLRTEASARLETRMLAAGRVRLYVDPGKPWGPEWLASASERVAGLSPKTVPKYLGVGALDYGLDELGRLLADGRPVDNPAGFVVDLAKRVMRRERWRWATEQDALAQPHLVVPLTPDGRPMTATSVRLVNPRRAATSALARLSQAASSQ